MGFPTAGKHKAMSTDKLFLVALGAGTAITVDFHGKMCGKLNGFDLSGFGSLEYTYVQGASAWVRSDIPGGSAQGPASIPVAPTAQVALVYDPLGLCQAKVSVSTDSDAMPETVGFKFRNKKNVWKMKGRTDTLTVSITQATGPGPVCDLTDTTILASCSGLTYAGIAAYCASAFPNCDATSCLVMVSGVCGLFQPEE